jgi:hypothetical protein
MARTDVKMMNLIGTQVVNQIRGPDVIPSVVRVWNRVENLVSCQVSAGIENRVWLEVSERVNLLVADQVAEEIMNSMRISE